MANFTTVEKLEKETGHKHIFKFYDNHSDTWDELLNENNTRQQDPKRRLPIGTVYECECGARELRFIVWNGNKKKEERS